jgi:ABC-type molybdate transport system substrate-binding protein
VRAALALVLALLPTIPAAAEPVRLAAAGSLRVALAEVASAFAAAPGGVPVAQTYAPSDLLRQIAVPPALSVAADYGLVLLSDRPEAARLGLFILSPAGQTVLARHGFEAPTLPRTPGEPTR